MKYYGSEKYPIVHFPFNFKFVDKSDYFTSRKLHEEITEWFKNMPKHGVANWVVSDGAPFSYIKTKYAKILFLFFLKANIVMKKYFLQ